MKVTERIQALAPFLKVGAGGAFFLEGVKCDACGEILVSEPRRACPKCAAVGSLHAVRLAQTGRLYAYTIVYRSFPGVKTPFVSALVDLDGGGTLKGNLVGIEPEDVRFGMPVRIAFEDVAGAEGARLVRYVFHPDCGDQAN